MNKLKIALGVSALLFSSVINATIIEYSITGTSFYYPVGSDPDTWIECGSDSGCSDILTGSMFVDDTHYEYSDLYPGSGLTGDYFEVDSFAFSIGDYGYEGNGHIRSTDIEGTYLSMTGFGSLGFGDFLTVAQEDVYSDFPVLPDTYWFNGPFLGSAVTTTDGLYESIITTFVITQVTSVPEPSIIWLLGFGIVLTGFARRKRQLMQK